MDLAVARVELAVGRVRDEVHFPVANELTVKTELVGALDGGRIGVEKVDERRGICHGVASRGPGFIYGVRHRTRRIVKLIGPCRRSTLRPDGT